MTRRRRNRQQRPPPPPPATFPFLRLPSIPIEIILKQVFIEKNGTFDVEKFADISKRSRRIVQSVRFPITGFQMDINDEQVVITYKIGEGKWAVNRFKYRATFNFMNMIRDTFEAANATFDRKNVLYDCPTTMKLEMEKVLALFRRPVESLKVQLNRIPFEMLPFLFPVTECEKMTVDSMFTPNDNVQWVLQNCKATKWFRLRAHLHHGFTLDPATITSEVVEYGHDSRWLTRRNLLRINNRVCRISGSGLSLKDLESVVTRWMRSADMKLEYLIVHWRDAPEGQLNLKKFKPKPFDPARRAEVFVDMGIGNNLRNGMDIERSDGVLATVYLYQKSFYFVVWHNRFPDLTGVDVQFPEGNPQDEEDEPEEASDSEEDDDDDDDDQDDAQPRGMWVPMPFFIVG